MSNAVYSVYMLRCADGSLYTGIATDVARRLQEHESGPRGAKYLRGRGPLELAFEYAVGDRGSASKIEYHLKSLAKFDKEDLVAGRKSLAELTAAVSFD
jgi:putative endonuclease